MLLIRSGVKCKAMQHVFRYVMLSLDRCLGFLYLSKRRSDFPVQPHLLKPIPSGIDIMETSQNVSQVYLVKFKTLH